MQNSKYPLWRKEDSSTICLEGMSAMHLSNSIGLLLRREQISALLRKDTGRVHLHHLTTELALRFMPEANRMLLHIEGLKGKL
jgi:hypothetical protein